MYKCSYNNLPYCFEMRILPKPEPLTLEKREEIRKLSQEMPEWMKRELETLEYASRVTHKDLSITINSPEPKYLKPK